MLAGSWPVRCSWHRSFYKRNYFCAAFTISYLAERSDEPPPSSEVTWWLPLLERLSVRLTMLRCDTTDWPAKMN